MKPIDKIGIVSCICFVAIIITGLAAASRRPLTPQQRIEQRKLEAEEYRKQLEEGQRRPSRFAEKQKRPGDVGYMPPTKGYIAITIGNRYCYVLDKNGQLSKLAKTNIKEKRQ